MLWVHGNGIYMVTGFIRPRTSLRPPRGGVSSDTTLRRPIRVRELPAKRIRSGRDTLLARADLLALLEDARAPKAI